ncbi:MAG: cobyric acid synthase CobQ, partial [Nitrospinota bacterium]|nr:cobyric acid synthase CobQ [Nitrospinota bacterium]
LFDQDEFRISVVNSILKNKKISTSRKFMYKSEKEKSIKLLVQLVRKNLDVKYIYKLIGL